MGNMNESNPEEFPLIDGGQGRLAEELVAETWALTRLAFVLVIAVSTGFLGTMLWRLLA